MSEIMTKGQAEALFTNALPNMVFETVTTNETEFVGNVAQNTQGKIDLGPNTSAYQHFTMTNSVALCNTNATYSIEAYLNLTWDTSGPLSGAYAVFCFQQNDQILFSPDNQPFIVPLEASGAGGYNKVIQLGCTRCTLAQGDTIQLTGWWSNSGPGNLTSVGAKNRAFGAIAGPMTVPSVAYTAHMRIFAYLQP